MNERWDEFDCSLASSLSDLPPSEELIQAATPFRDAVSRIVSGLILTSFTLNLWYLQYLLPTVGSVLLYLGFRSLRNNNRWFRLAWLASAYLLLKQFCTLVLLAAPCGGRLPDTLLFLNIALTLGLYFCFYLGFAQAAGEVGQPAACKPALAAAVWRTVLVLIALLLPGAGWLVSLPMIAAFVCVIRSLLRVSEDMEGWGYAVRAAPVHVSGGRLAAVYLGLLAAAVLACAVWANHPGMVSSPLPETPSAEASAVAERLTGLGFPEELLSRLPEEEILRLKDALACSVDHSEDELIGSEKGRETTRFETVYVQLEQTTVRVYEFFILRKDTLRSNWRTLSMLNFSPFLITSEITGGVTWRDKTGRLLWSGMDIGSQTHEDFFFGTSTLPAAVFAYPFGSRERGGYMAYTARPASSGEEYIGFASVLRLYFTTGRNFYPYNGISTNSLQTDWYTQSYSSCDFGPTFQSAS